MNITEQGKQIYPHSSSLHSRWPLMTTKYQHLPIQEHSIQNEATAVRALLPHAAGAGSWLVNKKRPQK